VFLQYYNTVGSVKTVALITYTVLVEMLNQSNPKWPGLYWVGHYILLPTL